MSPELIKDVVKDSGNEGQLKGKLFEIIDSFVAAGNDTLNHPELKKMMAKEKVDLIITGFVFNNYFVGLAEHFDCPVVIISLQPPTSFVNLLVGNPVAASGLPHFFLNMNTKTTFFVRVKSILMYIVEYLIVNAVDWKSKQLYK